MAQFNEGNVLTFRAAGAIGRFLRVKAAADATYGGTRGASVSVAGATDREVGTTENDVFDAGHEVPVRVRNAIGTRIMVANGAYAVGTTVFTAAAGKVGGATGGSFRAGVTLSATSADGDFVEVLPDPGDSTTPTPPGQVIIPDPGNAGAIPVTATGNVPIVTAGAETRTIAAAAVAGISLLLDFKTRVGNCVITVASTINTTGNNTITMSAAGQSIELMSVASGGGFRWAVKYNDGTALSTV